MRWLCVRTLLVFWILGTVGCASLSSRCPPTAPPIAHVRYQLASWGELTGWREDQLQEAWPPFLASCTALTLRAAQWAQICTAARALGEPEGARVRTFFEQYLQPYRIERETGRQLEVSGLITGYYEPQLEGARSPSARFNTPLYAPPADLLTVDLGALYPELKGKQVRARLDGRRVVPYYSRAELADAPALAGFEIVWVDSPLDAFLLEVQGSGRVQLSDGVVIRLHYADQNGQPYHSIGRYLVEHGELTTEQASMPGIRDWVAAHPQRLHELLDANPSVVFFREEPVTDPTLGPTGSLGVSLTAGRSIAVDRTAVPLGAPVFLVSTWPASTQGLSRLMLAQDTGGAIRGPVRADIFWGTGPAAADEAGNMRQRGSLWLLWPKGLAVPSS